jgi:ferrous iron transport protein B
MSDRLTTVALVGAPNSGKSTLFNGLTGGLAKTANYAGVTIDIRRGRFRLPSGGEVELIDLPGVYGLDPRSEDERITLDALRGAIPDQRPPDILLIVTDAANLRTHLHTVIQFQSLGIPVIVALNMIDLAERDGVRIDLDRLSAELEAPVAATRATRKAGRENLVLQLDALIRRSPPANPAPAVSASVAATQKRARRIASQAILSEPPMNRLTRMIDAVALHRVCGPVILLTLLFIIFQSVFAWSEPFIGAIERAFERLQALSEPLIADPTLSSLVNDGLIAGVGSVLVFLPQIIILFAFILALEASGYMARAAFLMDEAMIRTGLNGRAFIPLLSSFACAIPGILAARTIDNERDRITTILVAPLMTCSARLPVYTLLIAAFIPDREVVGLSLQGLVLFFLYLAGILSAVLVAFVLKRTATRGPPQALVMELPTYKLPVLRDYFLALGQKALAFLSRAGTIILLATLALWALVRFPGGGDLRSSYAGAIGAALEPVFSPAGFNLEMIISLVPGLAAREAAVSSLGLIYAVGDSDPSLSGLQAALQAHWSLPSALAFLAWYVYAPQCMATIATVRRETNSWSWTALMIAYLTALAYVAAALTFNLATWAGL